MTLLYKAESNQSIARSCGVPAEGVPGLACRIESVKADVDGDNLRRQKKPRPRRAVVMVLRQRVDQKRC